jgi:predicted transglutaminase-like cysteine proteinase
MFSRVASSGIAWGFGVLLVVWPVRSGIDHGTLDEFAAVATPNVMAQEAAATLDAPQRGLTPDVASAADIAAPAQKEQDPTPAVASAKVASLEPFIPQAPSQPMTEPFGLAAMPVTSGDIAAKWSGVEADIRAGNEILGRCGDGGACPRAARNFLAIVAEGRAQNGRVRIGVINRAINLAIEPTSDLAQWGTPDKWSAPLETFTTGKGDCEDYAIAKYVALTAAGVAARDVRLIVVRNTAAQEDHAVVAVHIDDRWIVLDNRWLTLVEDREMPQVVPLFVLDDTGVRQFAPIALTGMHRVSAPGSLGF